MERFAFRIALKANLYKICRLCGIDNPEKVPILKSSVINIDGEPELWEKIQGCIGFTITKNDKMPQKICSICFDKINDFYEFREMCFATNAQTRQLLGIKSEEPKKKANIDIKLDVDFKDEPVEPGKRGRKRKVDILSAKVGQKDISDVKKGVIDTLTENYALSRKKLRFGELSSSPQKKQKLMASPPNRIEENVKNTDKKLKPKEEIKDEPMELAATSSSCSKLKQMCTICDMRFSTKVKLKRHQMTVHIPDIPRYVCTACNEILRKNNDIKNHQLWHKLSKTPFTCAFCGETLTSVYAYTRHLREHCYEVPTALLVLDRECPQCHQTFVTNFLYNTHPCATRSKKCAGCNRQLRNEVEYIRHAAMCSKVYINYSKHIPVAAVEVESCVRIKNENDVEAAVAAKTLASSGTIPLAMAPVVSLTRLPTMPSNLCSIESGNSGNSSQFGVKTTKKSSKKGVSRKDLKRVDDLLKSTLDTLVSIKHEPEVHVDTDIKDESECNEMDEVNGSDEFHNYSDDDDQELPSEQHCSTSSFIKQEVFDDSYVDLNNEKEIMDTRGGDGALTCKIPTLKIKITKEHGTLNSSIVDVGTGNEKRKKKKKRKDSERTKEKMMDTNQMACTGFTAELGNIASINMPVPGNICIKQERIEEDYQQSTSKINHDKQMLLQPEATVMTSIPLMQFQISCISSGVELRGETVESADVNLISKEHFGDQGIQEELDVKPNLMELNEMLKITNITSGTDIPGEKELNINIARVDPSEESITTLTHTSSTESSKETNEFEVQKCVSVSRSGSGKAVKSTGGVARAENKYSNDMPQIVAVSGGIEMPTFNENLLPIPPFQIKPEPLDRDYDDEAHIEDMEQALPEGDQYLNESVDSESCSYKIDFSNIKIKQEMDIEVTEVGISNTMDCNVVKGHTGIVAAINESSLPKFSDDKLVNEEYSSDSSSEDYYDSEDDVTPDLEEEREYRELELPPLLINNPEDNDHNQDAVGDFENSNISFTVAKKNVEACTSLEEESSATILALKIDSINMSKKEDSQNVTNFVISNVYSAATDMAKCNESMLSGSFVEGEYLAKGTDYAVDGTQNPGEDDSLNACKNIPVNFDYQSTGGQFCTEISGCLDLSFKGTMEKEESQEKVNVLNEPQTLPGKDFHSDYIADDGKVEKLCHTLEMAPIFQRVSNTSSESGQKHPDEKSLQNFVGAAATVKGDIVEEQSNCLEATPIFQTLSNTIAESTGTSENTNFAENTVEMQQNLMNQQMAANTLSEGVHNIPIAPELFHSYLEEMPSSSGAVFTNLLNDTGTPSTTTVTNYEETENSINENVDAAYRQHLQRPLNISNARSRRNSDIDQIPLDDSNINEIAENNNNANIERELQDDNSRNERISEEVIIELPPNFCVDKNNEI